MLDSSSKRDRSKSPASSQADTDEASTPPTQAEFFTSSNDLSTANEEGSLGEGQWEETYLQQWAALADNLGGGWFVSGLCSQTIPQLSRTEPAIRFAAMAVGALASAFSPNTVPGLSTVPATGTSHYNRAITYYGRALRLVRLQQNLNSDYTLRVAIVACGMFACFEALHDSPDAAINHINHGLMIVEQFMCSHETMTPDASGYRTASPGPFVLDNEILLIFRRLECVSWTARTLRQEPLSPSPVYLCPPRRDELTPAAAFTDMGVARKCLDSVQHQLIRSMATAGPNSPMVNDQMVLLQQWLDAFSPLYKDACSHDSTDRELYFQVTALLLQYHSVWACLHSSQSDVTEVPRFREIIQLSKVVLANQPRTAGCTEVFTMDHGTTPGLLVTATRCADPSIRAEALSLLKAYPRRDAFWHSQAIARVIESSTALGT